MCWKREKNRFISATDDKQQNTDDYNAFYHESILSVTKETTAQKVLWEIDVLVVNNLNYNETNKIMINLNFGPV